MLYKNEEELLYKAKQAEGKSFREIDRSGRIENEKAKGHLGQIIEESYFEYEVNSISEADFSELGIELKVTPIKKNKNGTISIKERLVLNIINYMEEANQTFHTSSLWKKNNKLLIMFYEWIPKIRRADYKIIKSHLHTFPEEDLEIIKQDWKIIIEKVRNGLAHELSEGDTNYLAASTKGANRSSLRKQPFSSIPAMQRAYSLKQSYMTAIARKVILDEDLVSIATPDELKDKTFVQLLNEKFEPYVGKTLEDISIMENIKVKYGAKSFLQLFTSTLLGIKGTKLDQIEEFAKANIQIKTVRLEPNGVPKEHMSFKNIDFIEWANESWKTSWLRDYFTETKFLFVVFKYEETLKENPDRKLYFKGIKLWNMPMYDIEGKLKEFWYHVQSLIKSGIELKTVQQKNRVIVKNNLPKPKYNGLCHIRPKGRDGKDKVPLPDGKMIAKQAFWLDNTLIGKLCNFDCNADD